VLEHDTRLSRRTAVSISLIAGAALVVVACSTKSSSSNPAAAPDASSDAPNIDLGGCTVGQMGSSGLLLQGRLLLPSGPVTGELLIDGTGKIACAAASCSATTGYAAATQLACTGVVISPALVNAHDHTEYATVPPEAHGDIRYEHRNDWREGADGATPLPTVPESTAVPVLAAQELRMVLGGATAILGSGNGGVPGLARNLGEYMHDTWLEGLTGPTAYFDTFPLGDEDGQILSTGCGYPSIEAAGLAFQGGGVYAPHLAEGINLAAQNEVVCASLAANDLVTSKTSIVHGVGLNATNVAAVHKAGASVIWSPRSNIGLYGNTTPVTEYAYAHVPIALGTDWLPSGSMNMLRELSCADSVNQKYFAATFSDAELWSMATTGAAAAAGFGQEIGALTVGMFADVAVFDASVNADYRAVIAASVEDVHLVLRGGQPLYGDAALVNALASGCTPLDVCGEARVLCDDVPNTTLAAIQASAATIYPLFFCRGQVPTDEPSCVPYRDSYPNGTSATDQDGDGIPDASDDCPSIFNPIRPMDGTKQADVDGDGYGDACDADPTNPHQH
jgi:hypothetical protein